MSDEQRSYRIFLKSFGCSSNIADGEFMSGCLLKAGFELVDSAEEADVLIYNTCAVKTPTENRIIEVLKRARKMDDKRLLVTGCLPVINPQRLRDEVALDAVLGPSCGSSVVEAVQRIIDGRPMVPIKQDQAAGSSLLLPKRPVNPVVSVIPVAQGCLGSCAYCCVVLARGRLRSFTIEDIVTRARGDVDAGAREVWLTGQDTGCYGKDIGTNLAELLRNVSALKGDFMVRVGMMTTNATLEILRDLVEAFQNDHVYKFVHLPVQSGDNQVLKRMNRRYTVEEFRGVVQAFRSEIPSITLATDVICGFPGESFDAFERTLSLLKEIKPDVVNISKFFTRPRTAAQGLEPKIEATEVTARSRKAAGLVQNMAFEKNKPWLGWTGRVLIDERGKQPNTFIGRNFAYKPIVVKSRDHSLIGAFVKARVTRAFHTFLEAEMIE